MRLLPINNLYSKISHYDFLGLLEKKDITIEIFRIRVPVIEL